MFAMMWNSPCPNTPPRQKGESIDTFVGLFFSQLLPTECYCLLRKGRVSSFVISYSFTLNPIKFFTCSSTAQSSWNIRHLKDKLHWEKANRRKNTIIKTIYSLRSSCLTCRITLCRYLLDRYVLCFNRPVSTIILSFCIDIYLNIMPQLCLS